MYNQEKFSWDLNEGLEPTDSLSQVGSEQSTAGSRNRAAAKRAALLARSEALKKAHEVGLQKLKLEQLQEDIVIEAEIAAATAEERVYEQALQNENVKSEEFGQSPRQVNLEPTDGRNGFSPSSGRLDTIPSLDLMDMIQLPKIELIKFEGDPLRYWTFINSFDNSVGDTKISDSAKLNRLIQYCTGNALEVVEGCLLMNPRDGYAEAKRLLHERFGNKFIIAKAWIDKVTEINNIKNNDKRDMRKFSDLIKNCVRTLSAMDRLEDIDNQTTMKVVVSKLPHYLQNRWRSHVVKFLKTHTMYPDIEELSGFIETAAEELDDPVFGMLNCAAFQDNKRKQFQDTGFKSKPGFRGNVSNFNVEVRDQKFVRQCRCCGGSHPLYKCNQFQTLNDERRKDFVTKNKLCFNCFSSLHRSYDCQRSSLCGVNGCKGKHSNLLHGVSKQNLEPTISQKEGTKAEFNTSVASHCSSSDVTGAGACVALPIVPVRIKVGENPQNDIITNALLDQGSTNTFCAKELADKLTKIVPKTKVNLNINTLTNDNFQKETCVLKLTVSDVKGKQSLDLERVFVVDKIPTLEENMVHDKDLRHFGHIRDIPLPEVRGPVMLLIGQDNPIVLAPLDVRLGGSKEPYATRTLFGWTINGPLGTGPTKRVVSNCTQVEEALLSSVQKFWDSESVADEGPQMSASDKSVIDLWDKSVRTEEGHYHLPIPFKEENPSLLNNFSVAESRLENLNKRLSKNPDLYKRYKAGIDELIEKGYAEKVPVEEMRQGERVTWYLPHHPVISDKKPDKLRIVFDCSSKFGGKSLNDVVHQGPDFMNSLFGVLQRFREEQIAVTGDVEAMFLQVKVEKRDRDALRFLWKENASQEPSVYRMTSHLFGGIWSPSCASYALQKAAEDYQTEFHEDTLDTVRNSFYVDDCIKSFDSEEKAIQMVHELCELLKKRGFKLTKWLSNSRQVLESIPVQDRAKDIKDLDVGTCQLPTEKALGIMWDIEDDQLIFKSNLKSKPLTKRGMLSVISSLFDPLGFLSPVILQGKLIFQDECRKTQEWDSNLETEVEKSWCAWLERLQYIENFKVPRCVKPSDFKNVVSCQLHTFADASSKAYGAVSYLRLENEDGRILCCLLSGKSRLAPMKGITIPRLELCAALLAAKLSQMLEKELSLKIEKTVFWSDSMVVLYYIKHDSRYQTFVANRVNQIRQLSDPSNWHHVETQSNPADDVSRGIDADKIASNKRWIYGPEFLYGPTDSWPKTMIDIQIPREQLEVKKTSVNLVETGNQMSQSPCTTRLIERYSCWHRLKCAVAWILRMKEILRRKIQKKPVEDLTSGNPLTVDEVKTAEVAILHYVQKEEFSEEIERLQMDQPLRRNSAVLNLDPVLNTDKLLCVGGRLSKAPISESNKHQIVLPKRHHIVTLIVRSNHEALGHAGTEHVLACVRKRFWIIKGRRAVKRTLNGCVRCKRVQGHKSNQKMADLPEDRVTPGKAPFSCVGVDCFGPFTVKRGRSVIKRYGCLFTCLCTRAIHLEKLDSMDTHSFIQALRRFEARRGTPEVLRSDNGSNFKGAQHELKVAWSEQQIRQYMLKKEIKWIFNPPTASHMGGVWERQIRTVRKVLESLSPLQGLQDEDLNTLFCEVERIVNSRPITTCSNDGKDKEPLSPNHLLLLRSAEPLSPCTSTMKDMYRKRWKYIQLLADQFWKRWVSEYLQSLQVRQKWLTPKENVRVGDVVLITDDRLPRNVWPLARVTQTFPGTDGLVRSVAVKTKDGHYTRPVHKLCLLESSRQQ